MKPYAFLWWPLPIAVLCLQLLIPFLNEMEWLEPASSVIQWLHMASRILFLIVLLLQTFIVAHFNEKSMLVVAFTLAFLIQLFVFCFDILNWNQPNFIFTLSIFFLFLQLGKLFLILQAEQPVLRRFNVFITLAELFQFVFTVVVVMFYAYSHGSEYESWFLYCIEWSKYLNIPVTMLYALYFYLIQKQLNHLTTAIPIQQPEDFLNENELE
ncbi:MAG: hypothetical protein MUF42_01440 [Cytophagaceae bacterium]|jgi:hypothetical protein|nr:hypothetical protein [Cytophagaceae bacterium]